ncbi:MAG: hypothetical protein P4L28_12165 [Paludibacteraceae bacterium]|nr:hypothetical protein [Paludibacteraceae bacterium]
MADSITQKETLKSWFLNGKKPAQEQFAGWMDSYWHKSEGMSIANVDNLQAILNSKANLVQVTADLDSKVDKVDGMGLSTNDYTNQEKASLKDSCIDFINYNRGGNGGDEFLRNGDSVFIDLTPNAETGFDPTTKNGLICFSLEAIMDEDDSTATVAFGEEKVILRWTDANNTVQTRFLYSNLVGTNASATKVKLKDIWGNVCLAYFTPNGDGICILVSAVSGSTVGSSGSVEMVYLNATSTTFAVDADTASMIKLNAETTGCTVTLPTTLTADKSVTFLIPDSSKPISINGTVYQPGDTVFCVFDYDEDAKTGSWSVNNTIPPTVPDYSDVTAKFIITDVVTYKKAGAFAIYAPKTLIADTAENIGALIFLPEKLLYNNQTLDAHANYEPIPGLYYITDIDQGGTGLLPTENRIIFKQLVSPLKLGTVRAYLGNNTAKTGAWINECDGNNLATLRFERLYDKADKTDVNTALGKKADLVNGFVPSAQLPSYVDDVIEGIYTNATTFTVSGTAITLETGKIYVSTDNNNQYRWSGTTLIQINSTDLSGYVNLTSAQTIDGVKTFIEPIRVSFGGLVGISTYFGIVDNTSAGVRFEAGTVYPIHDEEYSLGRDGRYFHEARAASFIVKNGTASQFLKADGSLDSNTYITTDNYQNFVDLTSVQTITGAKTFTNTFSVTGTSGSTTVSGAGTRLMWIPEKAAFRAGSVDANEWDLTNIGMDSAAIGYSTTASGQQSFATGYATIASGQLSFTSGYGTTASGPKSHAEGALCVASGDTSHAEGYGSVASGLYSHASGFGTTSSGEHSFATGSTTIAGGVNSFSTGFYTIADANNQAVFGTYNKTGISDALLVVGNGSSNAETTTRSNAFVVKSDGSATATSLVATSLSKAGFVTNDYAGVLSTTTFIPIENGGTGSTSKNFVDLTTDQTIAGVKTFSSGLSASGNVQLTLGSDAAGDIFYRGSDGYLKKLAKGTDGQVLTLTSGLPSWETIATAPSLAINKTGANGIVSLQVFAYPSALKVSAVTVMSNASNISVQIGSTTYDKDSLLNVVLPANTELTVLDVTTKAGYNTGSAIITFSKA